MAQYNIKIKKTEIAGFCIDTLAKSQALLYLSRNDKNWKHIESECETVARTAALKHGLAWPLKDMTELEAWEEFSNMLTSAYSNGITGNRTVRFHKIGVAESVDA